MNLSLSAFSNRGLLDAFAVSDLEEKTERGDRERRERQRGRERRKEKRRETE